jgi:type II secretory pathway component PulM
MNNLTSNILPMSYLDFDDLPTSAIILSDDDIDRAAEISSSIPNRLKEWQVYLNCLALSAFEKWLDERAESLKINLDKCTILQPALANFINAVANLQVDEFKVCLIATGSLSDEMVRLPRVIIDLPEFIPHFYVLVEVLEERQSANIYAFLSYQELLERQNLTSLQSDGNYQLPISCFDNNPDRLLLYLRCLEVSAISLPAIPTNRTEILARVQNQLLELLPELQLSERELADILTWEQATAVFTHPELLNWIYTLQQENHPPANTFLRDLIKLITQPAVNAGRWLENELDELAQGLSWVLLPSFVPASGMRPMRSPEEEFEVIATQLRQRGLEIPIQARGAYQDILLAGIPLRMYAVTWHLVGESEQREWSLLLILGAPALSSLPADIKLRVSDQTGILDELGLNAESEDAYIFTRVVGNWDEKFLVSVSLMDGVEVTLPPFAFDLGR